MSKSPGILLFILLGLFLKSNAQLPGYGVITPEEVTLNSCEFDKEADAIILMDHAVTNYADDYSMVTVRRIRIKILKESGLGRSDIRIPYYSKNQFEFVGDVKGYVYNSFKGEAPSIINLEKSALHTQKVNDLYSEIRFAMPGVKVGSIIEYQYQSQMKSYSGLTEWNFQSDLPTRISHYDLTILPSISFAYRVSKSPTLPVDLKYFEKEGRMVVEMRNIAALRDEPLSMAPDDYRQKVIFQLAQYVTSYGSVQKYATNWEELNREMLMNEYFYRNTEKSIGDASEFIKTAKAIADPYARMVYIHRHFQKSFSLNGYSSKFALEGLRKVWENRSGSTGELNLLLINLLKAADLDAHPLLVSEHDHGKVNTSYPFEGQFNKVIANVLIDGKGFYLDATDTYTPSNYIPLSLLNTIAFRVHKKKPELIQLTSEQMNRKEFIGVMATLQEDGIMKGTLSQNSSGYSRLIRLEQLAEAKSDAAFLERKFRQKESDLKIENGIINNKTADSLPLEQKFDFTITAPENGGYRLIDLNLFSGIPKSPFVSDIRFTDINFECPSSTVINSLYKLPANWIPESLPKNINLLMPDNSIQFSRTCIFDADNSQVSIRMSIKFDKATYPASVYPSLKDFYKKMADLLNEPLVVKKK